MAQDLPPNLAPYIGKLTFEHRRLVVQGLALISSRLVPPIPDPNKVEEWLFFNRLRAVAALEKNKSITSAFTNYKEGNGFSAAVTTTFQHDLAEINEALLILNNPPTYSEG